MEKLRFRSRKIKQYFGTTYGGRVWEVRREGSSRPVAFGCLEENPAGTLCWVAVHRPYADRLPEIREKIRKATGFAGTIEEHVRETL